MSSSSNENAWLIYDGECPFCRNYIALVKLRKNIGSVRLINAREFGPEVQVIREAGLDLDDGMVLNYQGRMYHGADCIYMIALLSEDDGLFGKINNWVFQSPVRSKALYPVLRFFRNMTLMVMGRKKINGGG
jgi:predicted DCC family thiol-disulfide oxidoreductase YuxK